MERECLLSTAVVRHRPPRVVRLSTPGAVALGAERLRAGAVVSFPTDTVYALAASLSSPAAVRRIYEIKHRSRQKPLPVLLSNVRHIDRVAASPDPLTLALAERFWPGPLTVIVPAKADALPEIVGPGHTVAVRVPDHAAARAVIAAASGALATTSANRSGRAPARSAAEVRSQLGDAVDLLLDGGEVGEGIASTLVRISGQRLEILRQGVLPASTIESAWIELRSGSTTARSDST